MLNLIKRLIIQPRQARLLQEGIFREAVRGYEMNQEGFPDRLHLPKPFAVGLPERAVELMLARLLYRSDESTLDIGHANATPSHRRLLVAMPTPRNLTGIDIADPVYDTRPFYARSVRADITANPFKDGEFNLIWCISALEHFGMDNSGYTNRFIRDAGLAGKALLEMIRILRPRGRLLITVPFGRYENHGWQIIYDQDRWKRLIEPVRGTTAIREWFFRHTFGSGWQMVPSEELRYTGYFDQANSGAAGLVAAIFEKKAKGLQPLVR